MEAREAYELVTTGGYVRDGYFLESCTFDEKAYYLVFSYVPEGCGKMMPPGGGLAFAVSKGDGGISRIGIPSREFFRACSLPEVSVA